MKAAPFEYARPDSLGEACNLLEAHGPEAKLIAGGQSLVPMMAMRLARPAWLIDIGRIPELQRLAPPAHDALSGKDGVFAVGAAVRQCVMEREAPARMHLPLLAQALRWVGHVQTRNRGTIGGSIAHGDASAEIPLVACVLDATLELRDASGATEMPAREFFLAPLVTAVAPEQCLAEIRFPVWARQGTDELLGCAFEEVSVRHGDFALVSACAQMALNADGLCQRVALGVGGAAPVPLALPDIAARLRGLPLSDQVIDDAAAAAAEAIDPEDDLHATAAYRRHLARVLVGRVLRSAKANAIRDARTSND